MKDFSVEPPSFLVFLDKPNHQTMACSLKYPIVDTNALETQVVPVRPAVIDLQLFRMPRVIQLKFELEFETLCDQLPGPIWFILW